MNTTQQPVAIITGASSGIGLGVTQALLERGWRVVATSRTISKSQDLKPSPDLVLVDGEVRLHRRRLQSGDEYQRRQLLLHDTAGDSADEEAKFGACGEHLGGPRGSTERRRARTFGGAVEVADAGCE